MAAKKIFEKIEKLLKKHNQSHLLAFWGQLDAVQRQNLLVQVEKLDFSEIEGWVANYIKKSTPATIPADFAPAPFYSSVPLSSSPVGREHGWDSTSRREIFPSAPLKTKRCFKFLQKQLQPSQKNTKPFAPGILWPVL